MRQIFLAGILLSMTVSCNKQTKSVPTPTPGQASAVVEVVNENEATDTDYTEDTDSATGSARPDVTTPGYTVWFSMRYNDFYMYNQPTVKLWNLTAVPDKYADLVSQTGGSGGLDFIYLNNLPAGLPTAKEYIVKKPVSSLYKRIKLKAGKYAVTIRQPTNNNVSGIQVRTFEVTNHEMLMSGSESDEFLSSHDGASDTPGKLKISWWNGTYKPSGIMVVLVNYVPGQDNVANYATYAQNWQTVPFYLESAKATGKAKANYVSYAPGTYYALICDDISSNIYGGQKITIAPGKVYPHLKIKLTGPPITD